MTPKAAPNFWKSRFSKTFENTQNYQTCSAARVQSSDMTFGTTWVLAATHWWSVTTINYDGMSRRASKFRLNLVIGMYFCHATSESMKLQNDDKLSQTPSRHLHHNWMWTVSHHSADFIRGDGSDHFKLQKFFDNGTCHYRCNHLDT